MRKVLRRILSKVASMAAPAYIAGPGINDAFRICHQIDRLGFNCAICPWDNPYETPEIVASSYREALHAIRDNTIDCYLSIKVPSLRYDFNLLKELLETASEYNIRIHFDALGPETASNSLALLEKAAKINQNLGYTLPSRWGRSLLDAERVIDLGVVVRVVKGQWPDPVQPNADARARFLDLIDILAGRSGMVAVASHDIALARESLIRLKKSGTPCELEQLFGLPFRGARVARPLGVNSRVYVPYGNAYLPYALSEMRKRPIILGWLIKDIFTNKNNLKGF